MALCGNVFGVRSPAAALYAGHRSGERAKGSSAANALDEGLPP